MCRFARSLFQARPPVERGTDAGSTPEAVELCNILAQLTASDRAVLLHLARKLAEAPDRNNTHGCED